MRERYRHELKYVVDERTMSICYERLKNFCQLDGHTNEGRSYQIRSVYFDDYKDSYFYENECGVDRRHKYRIRIYNHSEKYISLEKKSKSRGMTLKKSVSIEKNMVDSLLHNIQTPYALNECDGLLLEFMLKREMELLKPVIIVQYERIPFIYNDGNVRVTLDKNISGSRDFEHFFKEDLLTRPIMETGNHVLEIKYDEFLPGFLQKQLNLGNLQRCSYSKYYLCRRFVK